MTAEINRVPGDAKRIKLEQIRPYRQFRELSRVKLTEKEGVGKEKWKIKQEIKSLIAI